VSIKAQPEWKPTDPLEPQEQVLLDHAFAGTRLDLVGDGPIEHEAMGEWGPTHTVRAAVLRHLLVEPQWHVHSKGVRLRGARISGRLDLESATLRCPLLLEDCYLLSPDPVVLDYATASRVALSRCRVVGGLSADLLVVTKELNLSWSAFEDAVRLSDADITGTLACRDASLAGTGASLVGDRLKVGGDLLLDHVTAAGTVRLADADITGQLSCAGARLTGTDRDCDALVGDRLKAGDVLLDHATAAGAVRLSGADITGTLACRDARFVGSDAQGASLVGDQLKVGGYLLLDHATAAGPVAVAGARIGKSLRLGGAELAEPVALKADGIHVGGQLHWAPRSPVRGLVDLERAVVQRLDDDWRFPDAHWPPAGQLRLAGFTYGGFGGVD
jgi:hypothetical protein